GIAYTHCNRASPSPRPSPREAMGEAGERENVSSIPRTREYIPISKRDLLSPDPCFPIELPDARHFLLEFQHADRTHHLSDRDPGVIGPEDAAILVFVIVETHFVTVSLPQR